MHGQSKSVQRNCPNIPWVHSIESISMDSWKRFWGVDEMIHTERVSEVLISVPTALRKHCQCYVVNVLKTRELNQSTLLSWLVIQLGFFITLSSCAPNLLIPSENISVHFCFSVYYLSCIIHQSSIHLSSLLSLSSPPLLLLHFCRYSLHVAL